MIISERIFELMKERHISQREFSKRTGIAQSTICDWKRKKTNPASDKLVVICEVLQISPNQLLAGIENEEEGRSGYFMIDKAGSDFQLLEQYHRLPEDDRIRLLGHLQHLLNANEEETEQSEAEKSVAEKFEGEKTCGESVSIETAASACVNAESEKAAASVCVNAESEKAAVLSGQAESASMETVTEAINAEAVKTKKSKRLTRHQLPTELL